MQVRERLDALSQEMTATERRLSALLLADYPFAGLSPIQELAQRGNTSPPTISRFVAKLGFPGYQSFQQQLIGELREGQRSPVDLQRTARPIEGNYLDEFGARAASLLADLRRSVSEAQFDRICALLADQRVSIYALGGRMSDTLVQYLTRHLRQFRRGVYHMPSDSEIWPEYLLRMRSGDVLFLADFRRYQPNLDRLARAARDRGVRVVVMTDLWMSPASRHGAEVIAVPIDTGTLWDGYTAALALIEALATRVAEGDWDRAKKRIEAWDGLRQRLGDLPDDEP